MTPTFKKLMVEYSARLTKAESFEELDFAPLAAKLCISASTIQHVVDALTEDQRRAIWAEIIEERIVQVTHHPALQAQMWERVTGRAATMLELLLAKNLIKDPMELLAVAKASAQLAPSLANQNGRNNQPLSSNAFTVNIHHGNESDRLTNEEEMMTYDEDGRPILPAGGEKIVIDLAPRMAKRMTQSRELAPKGERVIDSERLDAEALRSANPVASLNSLDESDAEPCDNKQKSQGLDVPDFMNMENQDGQ